jgi:hypothetical protein
MMSSLTGAWWNSTGDVEVFHTPSVCVASHHKK